LGETKVASPLDDTLHETLGGGDSFRRDVDAEQSLDEDAVRRLGHAATAYCLSDARGVAEDSSSHLVDVVIDETDERGNRSIEDGRHTVLRARATCSEQQRRV
jgi:hypothetical protein